jgi:hypothetical protein
MATTNKNKKSLERNIAAAAVCLVVFTLGSMLVSLFASQHVGLLAFMMTGAIVSLAVGGALCIKATWTRIDENRAKGHWSILDSKLLN